MMTRSKNNTPCRLVSATKHSNKENVFQHANTISTFENKVLGKRSAPSFEKQSVT